MTMIAKVAKAIYDAFDLNNERGGYIGAYRWLDDRTTIDGEFNLSKIAKAAIEAMREPTDEMIVAALLYMDYEKQRPGKSAWNGRSMWKSMIDEALKDE